MNSQLADVTDRAGLTEVYLEHQAWGPLHTGHILQAV